jgi:hypothetical protein
MPSTARIGGAFGLLLPDFPQVAVVYGDLKRLTDKSLAAKATADPGDLERAPEVLAIRNRLVKAFAEGGIIVPDSASLLWTGSEADRLAQSVTPADEWILGYGIFTDPWDYPPMEESFKRTARFHSWVSIE